jgi:tetratricopeptide (TPR) repeat protein
MKLAKGTIPGLLVVALLIAGGISAYFILRDNERAEFAKQLEDVAHGGTPVGIDNMKKAIALYETEINRLVDDTVRVASYWKILAARYQERGLFNEALEALEHAQKYNPDDPVVANMIGVSAANIGKGYVDISGADPQKSQRMYALAEEAFLKSIELNETYSPPLYGIGVLYTFDLNRPADAIPYLQRQMELVKNDYDTMFVLARAYYMTKQYEQALDMYDQIIANTRSAETKAQAETNKQQVWTEYYG